MKSDTPPIEKLEKIIKDTKERNDILRKLIREINKETDLKNKLGSVR